MLKMPLKNYVYFDMRKKNEIILEYKNTNLYKNKQMDLVHYSLTSRGSALYYQKLVINKIFRLSELKYNLQSQIRGYTVGTRFISFGGDFQQKYCFLTTLNQTKRNVSNTIFGNDASSIGTFKNFMNNSSWLGSNSIVKKWKEARKTSNRRRISWNFFCNVNSGLYYLFSSKIPDAKKTLEMKSKYSLPVFKDIYLFKNSLEFGKMKERLLRTTTCLTYFIRTLWFRLTLRLNEFWMPHNTIDYSGNDKKRLIKTEGYHRLFAANMKNNIFSTLGSWPKRSTDLPKELQIYKKGGVHRRLVRRHVRWRLGISFWGCKVLRFKKNYLFWKYARGLSNYFYRGYHLFSVFSCRADMFILRTFGVKSLKFARILVMSRHIFIGNYPIKDIRTRVLRYNLVTISKKANIYLNKRKYFKHWKNKKNKLQNTITKRSIKSAPLRFCRQQKDLIFWGQIKNTKYSMFFGANLGVLNADTKKTKFFSLNYFFVQKAVATSWW